MNSPLYLESSAILRAILVAQADVLQILAEPRPRVASILTFMEAERVLIRSEVERAITSEKAGRLRTWVASVRRNTRLLRLDPVTARALQRFPVEPIRSLDALHVATAAFYRDEVGAKSLEVLSTDKRVRDNAQALGMRVSDVQLQLAVGPKTKRPVGAKARSARRSR